MNIKKEFDLFITTTKMKIMDRMVDKIVFIIMSFGMVIRIGLSLIFFKAIYAQVPAIGGWSFSEVTVLLGTYELLNTIAWTTFFRGGFRRMPVLMIRGDLDTLLTRPINLQLFFIYENNDLLFSIPQYLLAIGLIVYGAITSTATLNIPLYLLLFVIALIINYSLVVILSSINFWTIVDQIHMVFVETMRLGRYPITIYKGFVRLALTIAIPVACMFTFPAAALFGNLKISEFGAMIAVAVLFFLFSHLIWNAGLRRYESTGY